jgi:hypothetical protein
MMQKVNVSHDKTKDAQDGEKERVTLSPSFKVVVSGASRLLWSQCRWKKKSHEEAKKKQLKELKGKVGRCSHAEFECLTGSMSGNFLEGL